MSCVINDSCGLLQVLYEKAVLLLKRFHFSFTKRDKNVRNSRAVQFQMVQVENLPISNGKILCFKFSSLHIEGKCVCGVMLMTDCSAGSKRMPATGVTFVDHGQGSLWARLEEAAVVNGGTPLPIFRPTLQCFTNNTDNKLNPITFVGGQCVCKEGGGTGDV